MCLPTPPFWPEVEEGIFNDKEKYSQCVKGQSSKLQNSTLGLAKTI